MEIKIYDKIAFNNDKLAQHIQTYLQDEFNNHEAIAYYQEPDYWTASNVLPTFTICSKKYGIVIIKVYEHTKETLTEITDKYWMINGLKKKMPLLILRITVSN